MIHNGLKSGVNWIKGARRYFGLDDSQEGVERLSESIGLALDLWLTPELQFVQDVKLCGFSSTGAGGGAGLQSDHLLCNTSNDLLIIVERVRCDITFNVGLIANIAALVTGSALIGQTRIRDSRWRLGTGMLVGEGVWRYNNTLAAPTGATFFAQVSAGVAYDMPIIVGPGAALVVESVAANVNLTADVAWRERKLLPGERGKFGVGA